MHKPGKVIAQKGKRCVGALTSGERGKLVTVVRCVSAVGQCMSLMFIFPRARMRPDVLDKAPYCSIAGVNPSGQTVFIC